MRDIKRKQSTGIFQNKKMGFTLVELLAVIIILGILMFVAIPSVTEYINNSRKRAYLATAQQYVNGLANKINSMEYSFAGLDIAYYVPNSCIPLERGGKSPFGEWDYAYAIAIFDGTKYSYYWASKDDSGYGIELTNVNDLSIDSIKVNFEGETPTAGSNIAIGGKSYILGISDENSCGTVDTNGIASLYREVLLNGAYPKINGDLIPVTIEDNGTIRKADIEKEWYSYQNKRWANAVILLNKTITYNNGDVIPEANIESYFVWIPRYRYKLWNVNNFATTGTNPSMVENIEIQFEGKAINPSTSSTNGNWLTNSAFTSFDVSGIWVGKFETGYKGAANTSAAQVNSNDSSKIIVKPNAYSWRNIQVSNAFTASYNYQRTLDSHMMKNTEWGAVAYLSHSIYGNAFSIRINNNPSYRTGYSAVVEPLVGYPAYVDYGTNPTVTQQYNTTIGYLASTTGNITGVYDMSGGSREYVMGIQVDSTELPLSGRNNLNNSGFNGTFGCPSCSGGNPSITTLTTGISLPSSKYYDSYEVNSNGNRGKRILGDATGETGPFGTIITPGSEAVCGPTLNCVDTVGSWHSDNAYFISSSNPWFIRGGDCDLGTFSGTLNFASGSGSANDYVTFRIVLVP